MPSGMKSTLAALACRNPYRHAQNALHCSDKQRLHVGSAEQLAAYLVEKFCRMSPGHSSSCVMDRQRRCRSWGIILLMEVPLNCTAHAQHSMCLTRQSACCNSSRWRSRDMSAESDLHLSPGMRLQLL